MDERVRKRLEQLKKDAAGGGYKINPDEELVADLAEGLLVNADRYGQEFCPCRLVEGPPEENMDIVCPCVYRDDDLAEYGACFCGLYVAEGVQTRQAPDRRPPREERQAAAEAEKDGAAIPTALKYPVYRCTVCVGTCAPTPTRLACAPSARPKRSASSGSCDGHGGGRKGGCALVPGGLPLLTRLIRPAPPRWMSTHAADEASYTINISVRASLWTRGEDIRLVLFPDGEAETLTCIFSETQTKAPGAAKHRRNYDDLECAGRWQLSRSSG